MGFLHIYIFILDLVWSLLNLNSKIFLFDKDANNVITSFVSVELPEISFITVLLCQKVSTRFGLLVIEVFPFNVPLPVSEESVEVIQVGEWDDMFFNIIVLVGGV